MNRDEEKAAVEAVLFTMGAAVEIDILAEAIGENKKNTEKLLDEMQKEYENTSHGIQIIRLEDSVQLATKASMYETLIRIAKTPRKYVLTDTVIETLSIIAYKQPVTRAEIERIRGVNCDHALNKLIEYDLVAEVGRLDAPGRPLLFGTTEQFLRSFGVRSLDDLPELSEVQVEQFKEQAEQEVKTSLDI
ncbi:MAG: SMC-Scp complex subunit ScpB [Lachnospiraceae bacterium]|jgi:segregation and condensation protein B|nr:SMC-Scp complex subunit ScpB [Lachnospiraceae bacterium]